MKKTIQGKNVPCYFRIITLLCAVSLFCGCQPPQNTSNWVPNSNGEESVSSRPLETDSQNSASVSPPAADSDSFVWDSSLVDADAAQYLYGFYDPENDRESYMTCTGEEIGNEDIVGTCFRGSTYRGYRYHPNPFNTEGDGTLTYKTKNGYLFAALSQNGKCGYVDSSGQWAIAPQFTAEENFERSGYARVLMEDGSGAYIDCDGNIYFSWSAPYEAIIVAPDRFFLYDFTGWTSDRTDLLPVSLVDHNGTKICDDFHIDSSSFYSQDCYTDDPNGLIPCAEGYRWGYIDTNGNWVILPRYRSARPFSEGLAAVCDQEGFCGYINTNGDYVLIFLHESQVCSFSEGLAMRLKGDQWQVITKDGSPAFAKTFTLKYLGPAPDYHYSEGVLFYDEYVDHEGNTLFPEINFIHNDHTCCHVNPFDHGLAFVTFTDEEGGIWGGYIDHDGNIIRQWLDPKSHS